MKKNHADMAFLLARIVLVLKLYIQGESCVRPMQASAAIISREIKYYDIVVQCTILGIHIM